MAAPDGPSVILPIPIEMSDPSSDATDPSADPFADTNGEDPEWEFLAARDGS
ncbi:hypothetical protein PF006_g23340 [Phytophthora fragariae]|uniref:Uncharacterized protein n=1 Tax=Phytophthora fragariae TaxID=53985 RepID=A0A6A3DV74_9STRA|nr:hypothetical protein PF009_g24823 [Phytophthora fragariae]KAE9098539.1 hypothetical protein PF006_g23340 [Phytophthora fragariae]